MSKAQINVKKKSKFKIYFGVKQRLNEKVKNKKNKNLRSDLNFNAMYVFSKVAYVNRVKECQGDKKVLRVCQEFSFVTFEIEKCI